MKSAITGFAVALGTVFVLTLLSGNAFAQCASVAKIKPVVLVMPQVSGGQLASVVPVAATGSDNGADGGAPIVGLWDVLYTSTVGGPSYYTHQQFHSDGLEIETPDFGAGGVCMGVWAPTNQARTIKIYHVGFTAAVIPGSYMFELREMDTVSPDRKTFEGWYDQKFFDRDGNLLMEDQGTLQGTRLSVDLF